MIEDKTVAQYSLEHTTNSVAGRILRECGVFLSMSSKTFGRPNAVVIESSG